MIIPTKTHATFSVTFELLCCYILILLHLNFCYLFSLICYILTDERLKCSKTTAVNFCDVVEIFANFTNKKAPKHWFAKTKNQN